MKKSRKVGITKFTAIVLAFILIISGCVFVVYKSILKVMYPMKMSETVTTYSSKYNVDKSLVYAIIKTESGFDKNAKSDAGALGLTQITPETFTWLQSKSGEKLETRDLYKEDVSIKYGCIFLGMLLEEFGNTKTAVAAYHAGRGKVNKWLKDKNYSKDGKTLDKIPSRNTNHYVSKVLRAINIYKNLYDI